MLIPAFRKSTTTAAASTKGSNMTLSLSLIWYFHRFGTPFKPEFSQCQGRAIIGHTFARYLFCPLPRWCVHVFRDEIPNFKRHFLDIDNMVDISDISFMVGHIWRSRETKIFETITKTKVFETNTKTFLRQKFSKPISRLFLD